MLSIEDVGGKNLKQRTLLSLLTASYTLTPSASGEYICCYQVAEHTKT